MLNEWQKKKKLQQEQDEEQRRQKRRGGCVASCPSQLGSKPRFLSALTGKTEHTWHKHAPQGGTVCVFVIKVDWAGKTKSQLSHLEGGLSRIYTSVLFATISTTLIYCNTAHFYLLSPSERQQVVIVVLMHNPPQKKKRAELGGWISLAFWTCDPRGHGWKEVTS